MLSKGLDPTGPVTPRGRFPTGPVSGGSALSRRNRLPPGRPLAAADIEDIMLQDPEGVCFYLNCAVPQQFPGRNGKAKMKNLFRAHGKAYHEGIRAKELIFCLNMERIISSEIVPLAEVEKIIFSK